MVYYVLCVLGLTNIYSIYARKKLFVVWVVMRFMIYETVNLDAITINSAIKLNSVIAKFV